MRTNRFTAWILAFLLIIGMYPASASAEIYDYQTYNYRPDSEDYCPYSRSFTHDWSPWYVDEEPTCTEPGVEKRVCMNECGQEETNTLPAYGHSFGSWETIKEATCQSEGIRERTCEDCGYTQEIYTDRLPHTWGGWTVLQEASDFSAGRRSRTCAVCGETDSQDFDPEGLLRRGDKGDAVKELQEELNENGYDCGTADGAFGPKTEAAVKILEEANGIAADGIAWPGVIKLLTPKNKPLPGAKPGLKLTGGQLHREGSGFNEIILMDMTAENTGDVPLSVTISSETWSGDPAADKFPGWPEGAKEIQPGEVFSFQYSVSLNEKDLDFGYIQRVVTASGHDSEHDLYIDDTFLASLPLYGEPDSGRIRLSNVNVLRKGSAEDTEITVQLKVEDLGKTDLEVWVRSSGLNGEVPLNDSFTDWPDDGEGSINLVPGTSRDFTYILKPSPEDLQEGRIVRTVTAEGIDPVSEKGFVSSVNLSYDLLDPLPAPLLHVNYHGGPGHEEDDVYQAGELLHLDYTVNNYSSVELCNARLLYEVLSEDGTCLFKDMSFTGSYGDLLDAPMFGGMLLYTLTEEAAAGGPLTVLCWAEAERTDNPGETVRSENIWRTEILAGEAAAPGSEEIPVGIGGPTEDDDKPMGRIDITADFDDHAYTEGESIDVTITITNNGQEPVNDLTGELYVMEDPEFNGFVKLEKTAQVYDDISTALAPGDSVTVTLSHVVTKEEAESGQVYLTARAEGHSTGVHSYCADAKVLTVNTSAGAADDPGTDDKPMGAISVSADFEEKLYGENDVIMINIHITNIGKEPVAQLMGQLQLMDSDEYITDVVEVPVYNDLDQALDPEESVDFMLLHIVTAEEAANGFVHLFARAEGYSTGVSSYCADAVELTIPTISGGIGGPGDEDEEKPMGRIDITADFDDHVYTEGESIDITITITNNGQEPVNDLMGELHVMDDPEFKGDVVLETTAQVFDDITTALAPDDSTTVTLSHVVTKEEAEAGHVYLLARADGHSTGVHSYCADAKVVTVNTSADGSEGSEESSKPMGRIDIIADFDDHVYTEGESIDITITITNNGQEPVNDLMGELHVMEDPEFIGSIVLEKTAQVYDDITTALAPDDSTTVTLSHVVTKEEAEAGQVYLMARADGHSTGVHSYCADAKVVTVNTSADSSEKSEGSSKYMGRIDITADFDDRTYTEGESIDITITITNNGQEPVNDLMGELHVMEDPEFIGSIVLEKTAQVYDDITTALAPDDSTTVTLSHVVTKEEAEAGHVYLLARADGHSTGVHSYCADAKGLTVNTSANGSETAGEEEGTDISGGPGFKPIKPEELPPIAENTSLTVTAIPETDYFIPRVPVKYTLTVENTGTAPVTGIISFQPGWKKSSGDIPSFSLLPGQTRSMNGTVTVPLEEADSAHDYEWQFIGDSQDVGSSAEGAGGFTLEPASMLYSPYAGLDIRAEAEEKIYAEGDTAQFQLFIENIADDSFEDIRIIMRHVDPDDYALTRECTDLSMEDLTVGPDEAFEDQWDYMVTAQDVEDGMVPIVFYIAGRNARTGDVVYDYFSCDLYTQQPEGWTVGDHDE